MNIAFELLSESYFPLLLKWLETPHIKTWWDQDVKWTPELIRKKYSSYTEGYKISQSQEKIIEKPMYSFIVFVDTKPIGYIQYYSRHDFPLEQGYDISELPISCAGFDWYIGESEFIGKGLGTKLLKNFMEQYVFITFDYIFVDPETANIAAIRTYEKTGFKTIKKVKNNKITWMINAKNKDMLKLLIKENN